MSVMFSSLGIMVEGMERETRNLKRRKGQHKWDVSTELETLVMCVLNAGQEGGRPPFDKRAST